MRKRSLRIALGGLLLCATVPAYSFHALADDVSDETAIESAQDEEAQSEEVLDETSEQGDVEQASEDTADSTIYGGGKAGSTYNLAYTISGTGNYSADPTIGEYQVYYKFTAPSDGIFNIQSTASADASVEWVQRPYDIVYNLGYDDNSASDGINFSLTGVMEAGEEYYFIVCYSNAYCEDALPFRFEFNAVKDGWNIAADGKRYYAANGNLLMSTWEQIDGYWYYFSSGGSAYCGDIYSIWDDDAGEYDYYGFDLNGRMITGIAEFYGNKYYFNKSGLKESGILTIDGATYYFNDNMLCDVMASDDNYLYYFGADGKAKDKLNKTAGWKKLNGEWYYYDGTDFVEEGWIEVKGKYYYMESSHPVINEFGFYPTPDGKGSEVYYFDANGARLTGWQKFGGNWYFFDEDGIGKFGIVEYKGDKYYILEGGMITDDVVSYYDEENQYYGYFGKDGKLVEEKIAKSGWMKLNGKWYYVEDGILKTNDTLEYNGNWYYFGPEGVMVTDCEMGLFGNVKRFDKDGHLVVGWYKDSLGRWQYYSANFENMGKRAENGIIEIDGKPYYFHNGYMCTDTTVVQDDGYVYTFDAKGNCSSKKPLKNGWMYYDDEWHYIVDGKPVFDKLMKIGNYTYGFNSFGEMISDDISGFEVDGKTNCYAFDSQGHLVTGWYQTKIGDFIYAGSDGVLLMDGIHVIDGKQYMFDYVYLCTNTVYYDSGINKLYVWDNMGNPKTYTANTSGWVDYTYYIDKGKVVKEAWKKIDGYWYYFGSDATKYCSGTLTQDGKTYYFDKNGRMQTGWIANEYGWYYADASGVMCTNQWKEINGKKYYFFYEAAHNIANVDGKWQLFDENNAWVRTIEDTETWVKSGNNWYYMLDGAPVQNAKIWVDGDLYWFDNRGVMQTNTTDYGDHYFGANGKAFREKWYEFTPGKWSYYDSTAERVCDTEVLINGKWYAFDEMGIMITRPIATEKGYYNIAKDGTNDGKYIRNGWVELGDSYGYVKDGIVVKEGFQVINGKNYCFSNGRMYQYETFYVDGYYFADKSGVIATGGWTPYFDTYVYATSTGKLLVGLQTIGGKQYYFGPEMATNSFASGDSFYEISSNGVVKNIIKAKGTGWIKTSTGEWLYSRNGAFVYDKQLIDGKVYYFDWTTGIMAKSCVIDGVGQIGANGVVEKTDGWIKSADGKWYYYERGNAWTGALCIGGKDYYFENDGSLSTGLVLFDGHYYYYDGNGSRTLVSLKDGWNECYGQWIYMKNGLFADQLELINGKWYLFYEGLMLTNYDWSWPAENQSIYLGANGTMVKNTWIELYPDIWVYYGADGQLVTGSQTIGGKKYFFDSNGIWEGSKDYISGRVY